MNDIYQFLLSLSSWPLATLLIAGGLYFTLRTKFLQVRMFTESLKVVFEKPQKSGSVSSFGALMISTASRVGTGNIIGVSTAICFGGAGAVFWMWVTAVIGGASAFVESTLAQIYKRRDSDGGCYGGPSFYIESALKNKLLAVIFAIALIFTYGVGYNMLASYNLQSTFEVFKFYKPQYCWFFGGATALLFIAAVIGGNKWIVRTTGTLVPFMGACYILLSLVALVMHYDNIPAMLKQVFADAFNFKAIFGGFTGSCIMWGLKRGLYSNEAGIGSAPNAAAAADVSHPVKQGLVQMLSVFIDTNLICMATAVMCLASGVEPAAEISGAKYIQLSLHASFGKLGPVFIAAAMVLFAYTTLLGNFYYVESCFAYLFGRKPGKYSILTIRLAGAMLIFLGAAMKMEHAWNVADISQCVLAFINIPVCIMIGGVAYRALEDYVKQRKEGKDPVYKAAENGVKQPTDFWN